MNKRVIVYSMPNCHYCAQAKEFLKNRGVDFDEFDVSKDKEAYDEMKRVSRGARSVPVITVCDEVMIGYDQERVEQALKCLEDS